MKIFLTQDCINWLGNNTPFFQLSGDTLRVYKENPSNSREYYDCFVYPSYFNMPDFCFETQTYSTTQVVSTYEYTNEFIARPDNYKICSVLFVIVLFCIFLVNIITSFVRRGGILSGLL